MRVMSRIFSGQFRKKNKVKKQSMKEMDSSGYVYV